MENTSGSSRTKGIAGQLQEAPYHRKGCVLGLLNRFLVFFIKLLTVGGMSGRPPKAPPKAPVSGPPSDDSHWNNVSQPPDPSSTINTCFPFLSSFFSISFFPHLSHPYFLQDAQTYVTDEQEAEDRRQKVRFAAKPLLQVE